MRENFKLTERQIRKLKPYMPNVEQLYASLEYEEFMGELNDAIVAELDADYEDTPASCILQDIYDEILYEDEDEEEEQSD